MKETETDVKEQTVDFEAFKAEILADFLLANESRQASLLGRKEVLTGKAKFGIFGDGKEIAQIALAKQFKNGDWRSGYYRDQTFMMAIGKLTIQEFFAQLYAHPDVKADPSSAGRQMNGHFATRSLTDDGKWKDLISQKNSSADGSSTASQMPRLLGLALASKLYRNNPSLKQFNKFSDNGNEVAFGTIGDASTSEGPFWETINAAGVLEVPMAISVWDDGYGISVPKKIQTTKESISTVLKGFERTENSNGYKIFKAKGWNYTELCKVYEEAISICRKEHIPVLIHVEDLTQPQGHSTSGSHERYKSKERLEWGEEFDCIKKFREWILSYKVKYGHEIASPEELDRIEKEAIVKVKNDKKAAWNAYMSPIKQCISEISSIINKNIEISDNPILLTKELKALTETIDPGHRNIMAHARRSLRYLSGEKGAELRTWIEKHNEKYEDLYHSHLYSQSEKRGTLIKEIPATYNEDSPLVDGRIILRDNFDKLFEKYPELLTFGEDTGFLGDVNQGLEGIQKKYGENRIFDTGIRETTIIGQGIGLALRGLRPIAEIQYLDYLLYGIQIMSDDLSTIHYRTKGGQKAPMIVRTRGHRLEGVWHSGSPLGSIINLCRGMYVCVPRNMTQAAGFYNTLLENDNPAIVIEVLNGYRSKEKLPANIGEYRIPIGIPEIIKQGNDITLVSYGATFNICKDVVEELSSYDVDVELIDVRTLQPMDINHSIVESLKKTNKLLVVDEDVPGGASAFIIDKVLIEQNGYNYLDAKPITLSAKNHRPAYASDGDYFSKPGHEDIFDAIYNIMNEYNPLKFPN